MTVSTSAVGELDRLDRDHDIAVLDIADPVLVATSARWTDGQRHWHSETRELVSHSTHPVLVVPAVAARRRRTALPAAPAATPRDVSLATDDPIATEELPVVTCWELSALFASAG